MCGRRLWDRWFMMGSIGVTVGLVGYLLFLAIGVLEAVKYRGSAWLVRHGGGVFVAWLFNMTLSCGLAAAAAWPVVAFAPAAAGAGVAEVMAYLNGCSIPKARHLPLSLLVRRLLLCATLAGPWPSLETARPGQVRACAG